MSLSNAQIGEVKCEVVINAARDKVWKALTADITQWWPADFYAGGEEGSRTYHLEATPGGRMYESWEGGGGVLWGTVLLVDPEVSLQVQGADTPSWGGPRVWFGTWNLEDAEGGTRVTFSEHAMGKVSDSTLQGKDKGWVFLWDSLKAHVEGGAAPTWVD